MITSSIFEKTIDFKLGYDIADRINANTTIVNFPTGYTILHQGEKSSCFFLIIQGIVRGYYIDDNGNDITKCFRSEGEFFSTEGFRTCKESSFTIECLESCRLIKFPYNLVRELSETDDRISALVSRLYLEEVGNLEIQIKNHVLMDAEERYNYFCKQYPQLHKRLPLKYIASYIGIQAASLSRIRKNQKK